MKKKYIIRRITLVLAIVIITIASFALYRTLNKKVQKGHEQINLNFESRVETLNSFDSGEFHKFGWLQVQGTKIDLPILDAMSSTGQVFYSYGWESGIYDSSDNRETLIGHNVLNTSSEPLRDNTNLMNFEELMTFVYYDFAKENLYVQYTKDGKDELYMIYAIGFYGYDSNISRGLKNKKEVDNYISYAKANSIYDYDIEVNSDDRLLSLITCTRMFGVDKRQQIIIDLRKVRKNEKAYKYNVKKTELFEKLLVSKSQNM